jgi:hypothetical protein
MQAGGSGQREQLYVSFRYGFNELNLHVDTKRVDLIPIVSASLFLEFIVCSFSASLNLSASGDWLMVSAEYPFIG